MTPHEAQRVIDALADGVDPETGELFAEESVLAKPSVIRALFVASRALQTAGSAAATTKEQPGQAGKPWSQEEDRRLLKAFDQGADLAALTAAHARSRGGIASRLVRLGRIKERAEIRARGNPTSPGATAP
ncbi:hypothetical protein ACS5PN_17865 [Roseateles sp. NT4]|uniref:hypothetical protein n=1 Tax=Roseateles sp. NT4 TaxID=3453715 RepID=UPI003EE8EE95